MVTLPKKLTPHTISCEDRVGYGATGIVLGDARDIKNCFVEDADKLVRDAAGKEVVSSARVYIRPDAAPVPVGSRITLWPGTDTERKTTVISVSRLEGRPGPNHYVLALQ